MAAQNKGPSIIIRRHAEEEPAGHHGGAWKVAYADFVTAMMAFFLLMWLLNATTEKQRQGLADYFNPTVIHAPNGQTGQGPFGGETPLADALLTEQGVGASMSDSRDPAFGQQARHVQDALTGSGAESMQRVNLLRHVVTRMTDEGLVIELSDLANAPLFNGESAQPTPALTELTRIVARVLGQVSAQIAVQGHVRSYPGVVLDAPVWPLSDARAQAARALLTSGGLSADRIQRVSAFADRRNRSPNPMSPANNRIEVILLK